jgi:hypothetical protein
MRCRSRFARRWLGFSGAHRTKLDGRLRCAVVTNVSPIAASLCSRIQQIAHHGDNRLGMHSYAFDDSAGASRLRTQSFASAGAFPTLGCLRHL